MFDSTARTRNAVLATTGALAAAVTALGVTGPASAAEGTPETAVTTTVVDPNDALLRANQMPVVNQVQDWSRVATRHSRVSTAQPEALSALGFTDKARRDFAIAGGRATNVVLTFADAAAAADAYAQLLFTDKNKPVTVEQGRGSYLSFVFKSDKTSDEGTFEWVGVTRRGTAVSIIDWRVNGSDATYDVDPTIASVQAANVKLARIL
jgi:hypothetical protein